MAGKSLRAQAAIEFLITNGWAILVVVILLAVLFYIGVLSPQNTTPNTCLFQPGFSCYTFKVGNGTGSLELDFGQATGKSIQVTGISCSQNSTAALHTSPLTEDITVPSGEHRWITGGTSPNSGIACEGATGVAGTRYKGTACVSYIESGTNTQRLVCGEINARLEPASIPSGSPTTTPLPTPPPGAVLIDTCPFTIDTTGYYYLNSSLNDESGSGCVTITADASNSILDCYGHSITGLPYGGSGVYITYGITSVTVRHCNINSFSAGIYTEGANDNSTITDNTASSNYYGIYSYGFTDSRIANNDVSSNLDTGMMLYSLSNNNLTGNTATRNSNMGIYVDSSSSNNLLTRNTACWNQWNIPCDVPQTEGSGNICTPYGETVCDDSITCHPECPPLPSILISDCSSSPYSIYSPANYYLDSDLNTTNYNDCIDFNSGSGSTLDCHGHSITGTSQSGNGISLNSVSGVTIENCNVSNFGYGIVLQGASNNNIFLNNTANLNSEGIALWWGGASNNLLTGNTASGNSDSGFYLGASSNNNLTGNTALGNSGYGIFLGSSSNNNFTENTACWNQGGNVYCDAGQNDGGSNICTPYEGTVCSDSITCNPTCPPPEPPACAPGWVVSSCPCTLAIPGNYTLESDLTAVSNDCISVSSSGSGANLDCKHHSITGSGGYTGISIASATSGVTIENCNVTNFNYGVYMTNSHGNNFTGNTMDSNNAGIYLESSDNNTLAGNTADLSKSTSSITLYSSNGNNLTGNIANFGSTAGIEVDNSNGNNLTGNTANSNAYSGIYMSSSSGNIVADNDVSSNSNDGIIMYTSSNNNLTDNTALANNNAGVYIDSSSSNNLLTANTACWHPTNQNIYCDVGQTDGGSNICAPEGSNQVCSHSVSCYPSCPSAPPPPACAPDGVVRTCGCYINVPGDYSLESDLAYAGQGECIRFSSGAAGSTLDCNHHSITGPRWWGIGISLKGVTGVTVKDCNVSSFTKGIYLESSNSNNLTGNTANSNRYYGIDMEYSSYNNIVAGNTACNETRGFYCSGDSNNNTGGNTYAVNSGCDISQAGTCPAPSPVISSCSQIIDAPGNYTLESDLNSTGGDCITFVSSANGSTLDCNHHNLTTPRSGNTGIYLSYVGGMTVKNCNINGFYNGIYLDYSRSNNITDNTANSGSGSGIYLHFSSGGNIISGNRMNQNGFAGISFEVANNNVFIGNNASSNGEHGVYLSYSSGNNLTDNTANSNSNYGFVLVDSSGNTLTGNNASSNGNPGIGILYSSSSNNVTGNTACNNRGSPQYDIRCDSAQPGDGGNICTNLNCVGVTCSGCP